MLDFSLGELGLIGAVALVVLGPERLPRVARTAGEWLGKAQRYVNQVKAEIQREVDASELKRLQAETQDAMKSVGNTMRDALSSLNPEAGTTATKGTSGTAGADPALGTSYAEAFAWNEANWPTHAFQKRYRPTPSLDDLSAEILRLKRHLALPEADGPMVRHKYAPRARVSRVRVRR